MTDETNQGVAQRVIHESLNTHLERVKWGPPVPPDVDEAAWVGALSMKVTLSAEARAILAEWNRHIVKQTDRGHRRSRRHAIAIRQKLQKSFERLGLDLTEPDGTR